MPFTNRPCLVTGGTGALGSEVVRDLLEHGAEVHVTWREARELDRIDFKDHVTLHEVNLGDEGSVAAMYASSLLGCCACNGVLNSASTPSIDVRMCHSCSPRRSIALP